ncbi:hypothetical protein SAMD00019534_112510, partial [Acytostelium subglobosum LB1]|uniref:hypothetical protein n=1 Tax=Acytostelium subglobosum LB1 TaxID=1410327 RepID=UPI000644AAD2
MSLLLKIIFIFSLVICGTESSLSTSQINIINQIHNQWRKYPTPTPLNTLRPLKWNTTMENTLQSFVNRCTGQQSNEALFQINSEWRYSTTGSDVNVPDVLNSVYNTNSNFDWSTSACKPGKSCLYTSAVWERSTDYACASSRCGGLNYIYCSYYPASYPGVRPYTPQSNTGPTQSPTPTQTPTQTSAPVTGPVKGPSGSIDWTGMMTSVKFQGTCGSCYIFSAIANLEAHAVIKKGANKNTLDLSEQYCLNCISNGCGGGWFGLVWQNFRSLPLESSMIYQGRVSSCQDPMAATPNNKFQFTGSQFLRDTSVQSLIDALQNGPVSVGMMADTSLENYKGGIYSCNTRYTSQNHAVLVVGYNAQGNYWIIKNSWGPGWGEGGFFRLTNNNDNCFMRGYLGGYPL